MSAFAQFAEHSGSTHAGEGVAYPSLQSVSCYIFFPTSRPMSETDYPFKEFGNLSLFINAGVRQLLFINNSQRGMRVYIKIIELAYFVRYV